jgi:hypothetical protein
MNRYLLTMVACVCLAGAFGCAEETAYADPPVIVSSSYQTGCIVVQDTYGEREICGVQYYVTDQGPIYWDAYYGSWIGCGGYWHQGVWHYGYWPGYAARYGVYYHSRGFYGHGYSRGYYHGNAGYHGGFHGGGHFGGGGHGGHR